MFSDQVRFLIFRSKQSSFYVFGVFVDSRGGGTPVKRIPEGLFCRFSKKSRFNLRTSKHSSFYGLRVFVDGRGRGTSVKRIHEGIF